MIKWIAAASVVLAIGCAAPSQPGSAGTPAAINQIGTNAEFSLAPGQQAKIDGTQIILRFDGVGEDSRCPQGVQCVWAGNAVVKVSITEGDIAFQRMALNTSVEPRNITFMGYVISLVSVRPEARQGGIPAGDYTAVFKVTRAP